MYLHPVLSVIKCIVFHGSNVFQHESIKNPLLDIRRYYHVYVIIGRKTHVILHVLNFRKCSYDVQRRSSIAIWEILHILLRNSDISITKIEIYLYMEGPIMKN